MRKQNNVEANKLKVMNVSFNEDGRQMNMIIQNDDEEEELDYENEGSLDDLEVSFKDSQSTASAEHTDRDDETDSDEQTTEEETQSDVENDSHAGVEHYRMVEEVDEQLQIKIKELESLMKEKGMAGAAEQLNKSFGKNVISEDDYDKVRSKQFWCNEDENFISNSSQLAKNKSQLLPSNSEATIYDRALRKRASNSSEDPDTSDELLELNFNNLKVWQGTSEIPSQIAGPVAEEHRASLPMPSTSRRRATPPRDSEPTPEERVNQKIRDAENTKATMFPTMGKSAKQFYSQTALIDESYMVVGNHLDETTITKIKSGDYVDFSKLVPRDRVLAEEDQYLEMVLRGGRTFFMFL